MAESQADHDYHEAAKAFDEGDFNQFLDYFFKAIHGRYDIEKPSARRLIRRKLNTINTLKQEIVDLKKEKKKKEIFLKRLAVEYTVLGNECVSMNEPAAAIANYKKALELYPTEEIKKRIKELEKKLAR